MPKCRDLQALRAKELRDAVITGNMVNERQMIIDLMKKWGRLKREFIGSHLATALGCDRIIGAIVFDEHRKYLIDNNIIEPVGGGYYEYIEE